MLYGMISTGFRPGDIGISRLPPAPPPAPGYAPNILSVEKLTSFELGSKNRFLDDSLQLNAAVYYYDYEGFQTSYRVLPTDFFAIPITVPARNIGLEVESLYRITSHDRVGGSYSYVNSSWKDEPAPFAAAYPQKQRALVPHTVNAYYEHVFSIPGGSSLAARVDATYYSAHRSEDLHAVLLAQGREPYVELGAQTIGNLSATWSSKDGRLSVTGYARNITNERTATYTYQGAPFSYGVDWNDPRIFGAIVSARF